MEQREQIKQVEFTNLRDLRMCLSFAMKIKKIACEALRNELEKLEDKYIDKGEYIDEYNADLMERIEDGLREREKSVTKISRGMIFEGDDAEEIAINRKMTDRIAELLSKDKLSTAELKELIYNTKDVVREGILEALKFLNVEMLLSMLKRVDKSVIDKLAIDESVIGDVIDYGPIFKDIVETTIRDNAKHKGECLYENDIIMSEYVSKLIDKEMEEEANEKSKLEEIRLQSLEYTTMSEFIGYLRSYEEVSGKTAEKLKNLGAHKLIVDRAENTKKKELERLERVVENLRKENTSNIIRKYSSKSRFDKLFSKEKLSTIEMKEIIYGLEKELREDIIYILRRLVADSRDKMNRHNGYGEVTIQEVQDVFEFTYGWRYIDHDMIKEVEIDEKLHSDETTTVDEFFDAISIVIPYMKKYEKNMNKSKSKIKISFKGAKASKDMKNKLKFYRGMAKNKYGDKQLSVVQINTIINDMDKMHIVRYVSRALKTAYVYNTEKRDEIIEKLNHANFEDNKEYVKFERNIEYLDRYIDLPKIS